MCEEQRFRSILAPFINGLLAEKRALGFDYHDKWCTQTDTEGLSNQRKRVSAVRQLMLYMATLGADVYLPKNNGRRETIIPHIFTREVILAFFHEIDSYEPKAAGSPVYKRLAEEYKVLFRLLYCCGLRNSEGCGIAAEQVDLTNGILTILDSKGSKDRLVYMAEDMALLCREYYGYICGELGTEPRWFFPALDPDKPLRNTAVDRRFADAWGKTAYAACCNDKPVVHDLRFTFVTNRINQWVESGEDIRVLLPYLSMYLGHKSISETHYYYHLTLDASRIAHEMDKTSGLVIPEVVSYE